ncbi:MAG: gamma-glutamyltransferase, partial [Verrucomicrobia bacterium]|nr:gamma-glutamyltransferase [Verrucomicrobiota bacterium]
MKATSNLPSLGLLLIAVALPTLALAAERVQGRSMIMSRHGIVATEHPLASQIGATILAQGGNAVDAAIAANAAMGLVGPMANGIGGDMFAIVYEAKSGKIHGLNASGWAPAGLSIELIKREGFTTNMPQSGIHSVTVPGCVDGWQKLLDRFGRKKMSALLAPSIRLAEEGFPVTEIFSDYWVASEGKLRKDTNAARVYLPGGRAPKPGEVIRNPDLAWSYKQIAR